MPFHAALPDVLDRLTARLATIADDLAGGMVREAVLRPVRLLEQLAADAPDALLNGALARERLRLVLFAAQPYAEVLPERGAPEARDTWRTALLHAGNLAIVALAAARVARNVEEAAHNLRVVHGLALSAAPAEALAALEPRGPEGDGLDAVLRALVSIGVIPARADAAAVDRALHLPGERDRRALLHTLFEALAELAAGAWAEPVEGPVSWSRWDGALGHPAITRQSPPVVLDGVLEVALGTDERFAPPALIVASDAAGELIARPREADARVELDVAHMTGVVWASLSVDALVRASHAWRGKVRSRLDDLAPHLPDDAPVPVVLVRDYPPFEGHAGVAVADRSAHTSARVGGLRATVSITPARAAPGEPLTVRWSAPDASGVLLRPLDAPAREVAAAGTEVWAAPAADGPYTARVVPFVRRGVEVVEGEPVEALVEVRGTVRIVSVAWDGLAVDGSDALLKVEWTPGRRMKVVLEGAAPLAEAEGPPPLTLRVAATAVGSPPATDARLGSRRSTATGRSAPLLVRLVEDDVTVARAPVPPPTLVRHAPVRLVAFRPVVVAGGGRDPVEERVPADALGVPGGPHEALLLKPAILEPVHAPDGLAVVAGPILGATDPRVPALLDVLATTAARAPGFEDATWVAVVPGSGTLVHAPAGAAERVAVVTPDRWIELLITAAREPRRGDALRMPRMALFGRIEGGALHVDATRVDERAAGPGARRPIAARIVTRDAAGRELHKGRLHVQRAERPCGFVALVPITPEVETVEVSRLSGERLFGVGRPTSRLGMRPGAPAFDQGHASWTYEHGSVLPRRLEVLAGQEGTPFLPLEALRPCADLPAPVPVGRLGAPATLRMEATDGWIVTGFPLTEADAARVAVCIRRLGDDLWYADVGDRATEIAWSMGEDEDERTPLGEGRTLRLPARTQGRLWLTAKGPHGGPLVDTLRLEGA